MTNTADMFCFNCNKFQAMRSDDNTVFACTACGVHRDVAEEATWTC